MHEGIRSRLEVIVSTVRDCQIGVHMKVWPLSRASTNYLPSITSQTNQQIGRFCNEISLSLYKLCKAKLAVAVTPPIVNTYQSDVLWFSPSNPIHLAVLKELHSCAKYRVCSRAFTWESHHPSFLTFSMYSMLDFLSNASGDMLIKNRLISIQPSLIAVVRSIVSATDRM